VTSVAVPIALAAAFSWAAMTHLVAPRQLAAELFELRRRTGVAWLGWYTARVQGTAELVLAALLIVGLSVGRTKLITLAAAALLAMLGLYSGYLIQRVRRAETGDFLSCACFGGDYELRPLHLMRNLCLAGFALFTLVSAGNIHLSSGLVGTQSIVGGIAFGVLVVILPDCLSMPSGIGLAVPGSAARDGSVIEP
jgi:hypothetical protein